MRIYEYIYGPVVSWRLGMSLGIDPVAGRHKACNFNCIYCQLGKTVEFCDQRQEFVATDKIIQEVQSVDDINIDYLTFSGSGEPTLARNLGDIIRRIKNLRSEKIAVITNSTLLGHKDVQEDLLSVDCVMAKLDASSTDLMCKIDRPVPGMTIQEIVRGIKSFRDRFSGKFALQMMFVDENKDYAEFMANLAKTIDPDEVQLNTPLRGSFVKPLDQGQMNRIKDIFQNFNIVSVYDDLQQRRDIHAHNKNFYEDSQTQRHSRRLRPQKDCSGDCSGRCRDRRV